MTDLPPPPSAPPPGPPRLVPPLTPAEAGTNEKNESRRIQRLMLIQKVLVLFSQRVPPEEIAARLKVTRARVYKAINEAKHEWTIQNLHLYDEIRQRELVDLDLMERQAAQEFATRGRDPEWLKIRLAIKIFRARLLGMLAAPGSAPAGGLGAQDDEPIVVNLTFGEGKPT